MTQPKEKHLYEGLFLFNPAAINSNLNAAIGVIQQFMDRAGADVIAICKWDDRKLAYEIGSQKRGLYLSAYFRAAGEKLAGLERDANLSEAITRSMVIRADHMGEVEINEVIARAEQTRHEAALQGDAPVPQTEADTETEAPAASGAE